MDTYWYCGRIVVLYLIPNVTYIRFYVWERLPRRLYILLFYYTGFVDEEGVPVNVNGTPLEPTTQAPASTEPSSPVLTTKPSSTGYPCELSESKVSVPGFVCQGQLLFEDNFDGPIERGQIWKPEIKFPGEPVSAYWRLFGSCLQQCFWFHFCQINWIRGKIVLF